jgi:hypothetical protein
VDEITTIGIDPAKNIFQVHGVDASGAVVVRKAYAGRSGSILVNLAEVGDTVAVPPHHLLQNLVA